VFWPLLVKNRHGFSLPLKLLILTIIPFSDMPKNFPCPHPKVAENLTLWIF
jgi:hypothetical protein